MTDKRQLAQKLAEIVFDMAEQDRCLSNPRLADRLYEVLVAAEAKPAFTESRGTFEGTRFFQNPSPSDPAYERSKKHKARVDISADVGYFGPAVAEMLMDPKAWPVAKEKFEAPLGVYKVAVDEWFARALDLPEFHMKPNKDTDA